MNDELQDLITRHLDGHLDVEGQRRLAELLAASADARQTFARYLRLEGAAFKLGMADQFELPTHGADHDRDFASPSNARSRWAGAAWVAVAASLLVGLFVGLRLVQRPQVQDVANSAAVGEMDRLAETWLELQDNPPVDEPALPEDAAPPATDLAEIEGAHESEPNEPPPEAESIEPPSWMVVAMADLATETPNPDERK